MPIKEPNQLGVIGPIRCPCGQVISPATNEYYRLLKAGHSKKYALDHCGLPTRSPLIDVAPASECCNAYIMCYIDSTMLHLMYNEVAMYSDQKRGQAPHGQAPHYDKKDSKEA
jgi:hypothetical protein